MKPLKKHQAQIQQVKALLKKGRTVTVTTEDMQKRRNDVKVRTTLLLALSDEDQLRFSKYKTAQELWAAILKTFGGNEATKKTKKNQLKQQYGIFKAKGKETLDLNLTQQQKSSFSSSIQQHQLMLGSTKFFTSSIKHLVFFFKLHGSINSKVNSCKIKRINTNNNPTSDLDTVSLGDLYNHLKVYEPEVQKKSKSNSQNMAFISLAKNNSGKEEVNTASILTASTQVSPASANVAAASISLDTFCNMALLSMRADRFGKKTGKKITIQGTDVAGFDKSKVECFNCHKMGHFARECRAPRSQDRGRRENFKQGSKIKESASKALMAIDGVGWDWSYIANEEENHALVEVRLVEFKNQEIKFCKKIRGLEFNVECKNNRIERLTNELEELKKEKEGLDSKLTGLPEFADDTITDYSRPSPSIESNSNDLQRNNSSVYENGESSSSILSKLVITFVKTADSPIEIKTNKDETVRKSSVKYAKMYRKPSKTSKSFNGNSQNVIDDKGYWDSGCSQYINGNISYLSDYEPYDGGYVSFGQGGGKITGKVVVAGTSSTNFSGTKDAASQDVKKDVSSLRYIAFPNWFHDAHLESSTSNAQDACKADSPESSGNSNPTATLKNPPSNQIETLAVETTIPTISSPVPTTCLDDSPEPSSDTRLISKGVTSQDDTTSLDNILNMSNRFEDILEVTTNTDDTNGMEADLGNMENNISASPTPTFRIHKDHLKNQIIGPVDTPVQTRTKGKAHWEKMGSQKKKDERGILIRNKARLVTQRDTQEEGIDYKEVFAPVAMIEAIRLFLAYASFIGFTGKDETGKDVDLHLYRSMIGSLMYLTASRSDIIFVVCACARHQVTPKECHLHAVKRIFRYLKGHPKLGLWYHKESLFDLVAYSDSDYSGATQDRKSTTGGFANTTTKVSHSPNTSFYLLSNPNNTVIMARLAFCDYHNMIAILEKSEHKVDFHQIVDFVEASHIRYALTINPTVYVSHIRQFWSTARIETTNEGTKILATVNGKLRTISKSSIRRNLKLNDDEGINTLPDAELFENLALMGVNGPSFSGRTVPLFDSILFHQGKGSGTPTEPHHTPSLEAPQSPHTAPSSPSLPPATTEKIPTSTPTKIPILRQYSRRVRIAQSSTLPTAADEPASPSGDNSQGEACLTVSGLEAEQDRANLIKTSTLPHDSAPRVTSLVADEGNMQQQLNELTDLYTRLQRQQTEMATKIAAQDLEISHLKARIKFLEDKDEGRAKPSGEDATIKGRSLEIEEEAGVERSTKKGKVSTVGIPTGSGLVPTTSPIFTTASVVTPNLRRKGKEKMVESDTPKKKKLQEQIDVQMMIDGLDRNNKMIAKHLHEYEQVATELTIGEKIELINELVKYQDHHSKILNHSGWKTKHFKGMSLEEIKEKFIPVWKQIEDFVPMASKEEGERFKRKGLRLEHESPKKIKTSKEVSQEDLKEMMQLVPVEEVYVEALQVKHLIIDWEIHSKGQRNYWKIIRLGGNTAVYQFFVDMLKHFDREDLIHLWTLVKETLSIRQATSDKEKELWVELKRLFEPDVEDQLWTHTQALMHDLVEWRLYDSCGVHHVLTKDQEIFMLVEKDYPLRKGLEIVMISNKLQVENYTQMANDLIMKIYNIANRPR
nr:hypothetical protein [Tanacetum cinerariifolium]